MNEWGNKALSELADFINGYAFKPSDWGKDGLPIIRIEQLKNPDAPCDYYSGSLTERNLIEDGDLVFSWSASLFLKIWKNGTAALNQHLFKVKNYEGIDKSFLKYLIEFNLPELVKAAHGSTMQHITRKELTQFRVSLPFIEEEQSQIAVIISSIDRAIEQTEAIIAKQQRIKTGLMQDLLTKGIDEHSVIRDETTHEFKDSPLGRIPKEWEDGTIGKSCQIHNNLRKPISAQQRELMQGDYPYYGPTGMLDSINEYRIEGKYALIGEDGDHFLKFKNWEMVQLVSGKFNVNNHAHIIKGTDRCLTEWFYYFFVHRDITFHLTRQGAGRFKLNKSTLLQLEIALPSIEEQERIIKVLETISVEMRSTKRALLKLHSMKSGLIKDLLTGKVGVHALLGTQV